MDVSGLVNVLIVVDLKAKKCQEWQAQPCASLTIHTLAAILECSLLTGMVSLITYSYQGYI